jgi:hypothetical protein
MNNSLIRDYCSTLGLAENYVGRQRRDNEQERRK